MYAHFLTSEPYKPYIEIVLIWVTQFQPQKCFDKLKHALNTDVDKKQLFAHPFTQNTPSNNGLRITKGKMRIRLLVWL